MEARGPVYWELIHTMAVWQPAVHFISFIMTLVQHFPCDACVPHFQQFIDSHPFALYLDIPDNMGMFQWSWELHHSVNVRLRKHSPPMMEAYKKYRDGENKCEECKGDVSLLQLPVPRELPAFVDHTAKYRARVELADNVLLRPK